METGACPGERGDDEQHAEAADDEPAAPHSRRSSFPRAVLADLADRQQNHQGHRNGADDELGQRHVRRLDGKEQNPEQQAEHTGQHGLADRIAGEDDEQADAADERQHERQKCVHGTSSSIST